MNTDVMDSRPTYGGLRLDPRAKSHLVVVDGDGAPAVLDAFAGAEDELNRTTILCAHEDVAAGGLERLCALRAARLQLSGSSEDVLTEFERVLDGADMSVRIYVAGRESFIGKVVASAALRGVVPDSVVAERRGGASRRVQCVHCKHIDESVTASPYRCSGCGQHLLVRDHFSRRLAAFQGVRIDAEIPGEVPPAMELTS